MSNKQRTGRSGGAPASPKGKPPQQNDPEELKLLVEELISAKLSGYVKKMNQLESEVNNLKKLLTERDDKAENLEKEVTHLKNELEIRDRKISQMSTEISDVQLSQEYVSHIAEENKAKLVEENQQKQLYERKVNEMKSKQNDLEDRSRRDNLLFWHIPEEAEGIRETSADCERKVKAALAECFPAESRVEAMSYERSHRLGRRKPGKTRAIIVKFTFHKDKQHIIMNSKNMKDSSNKVSINEDFCAETIAVRKQLWQAAKSARDTYKHATYEITHVRLAYLNVVLSYFNHKTEKYITRSFSLRDTRSPGWYEIKSNY